jgi:hypothetical protein
MNAITRPTASSGNRPRNASGPRKGPRGSNGQGANSALAEMLRKQAQNPRPGGMQQQPRAEVRDPREPRPNSPRKSRG